MKQVKKKQRILQGGGDEKDPARKGEGLSPKKRKDENYEGASF